MNDLPPPTAATAADPWVDPDTARILVAARAATPPDYPAMPMAEARRAFAAFNRGCTAPLPDLAEIRELAAPGGAGEVRARLYRPAATRLPVVVYLHGGGWTFGSVDTHDRMMRLLALDSGCAVLGIDYRLAPEHPFPAAQEDALAAIAWLAAGGAGDAVDAARWAVAGDSAGANLALAVMLARRDSGQAMPRTAALFYGCFAPEFDTPSNRRFGDGYVLTTERMRWFWANHLGAERVDTASLAAPGRAPLHGLPPLFLNAAGLDPLLDDTLALAARLAHAGIPYVLDAVPGVLHGFLQHSREVRAARAALARAGAHLAAALAPAP